MRVIDLARSSRTASGGVALFAGVLAAALLSLTVGCGGDTDTNGGGGGGGGADIRTSDGFVLGNPDTFGPGRTDATAPPVDASVPSDVPVSPDGPGTPDVAVDPDVPVAPDVPPPPDVPRPPDQSQPPTCGYGDILGVVCSPSGTVYINDALVYVETTDCQGQPVRIETLSDANGEWTLEGVPSGRRDVEIRKGSFQHTVPVDVRAGELNDLRGTQGKLCFGARAARIAVVGGTYDSIEEILDGLGVEYDFILEEPQLVPNTLWDYTYPGAEFLMDAERLSEYHIVFLNCSEFSYMNLHVYGDANLIGQNLSAFVHNGGSLYASDWASAYVERPWPGTIDFHGNDAAEYGPRVGYPDVFVGTVEDQSLAAYLGKVRVNINFDLPQWVVMESAASAATVHIQGAINIIAADGMSATSGGTVPLMVSWRPYPLGGRVLYTSFHNEQQITDDMSNILNFLVFNL